MSLGQNANLTTITHTMRTSTIRFLSILEERPITIKYRATRHHQADKSGTKKKFHELISKTPAHPTLL